MPTVKHATSVQGADEPGKSVQAAQWNEDHFLSGVADQLSLDAETSSRIAADDVLSNRIGSVNSILLSGFSTTQSGGSSVRGTQSVINTLQAQLDNIRGDLDNLEIDSLFDVSVGGPGGLSDGQVIKWNSAQQQWIADTDATGGAGGSVTSTELSAVSAAAQSALSTETSARTAADNTLSAAINVVSNALSNELSVRAAADTSIMSAVSVESAARAAADISIMSAVSVESAARAAADTSLDGRITSGLGRSLGNISGVSIGTLSDTQVLKWNSAQGQWTNATDATGGSAEPTSNQHSVLSQAVSALSARVNADALSTQMRVFNALASISAAALTNIPSLSLSLEAGGTYIIDGAAIFDKLVSGTWGFGASVPTLAGARGSYLRFAGMSVSPAAVAGAIAQAAVGFSAFAAGQTVVLSTSAAAAATGFQAIDFKGLLNVSTGGTFHLMTKGSTAAVVSHIVTSGWVRAKRIA